MSDVCNAQPSADGCRSGPWIPPCLIHFPCITQIHPDRYSRFPEAQQVNSESLKLLNSYADNVAEASWWRPVNAVKLDFQVLRGPAEDTAGGSLRKVSVQVGVWVLYLQSS